MVLALSLSALSSLSDLARPNSAISAERLSNSPNVWLTRDFFSPETVAHMRSVVPTNEDAYTPCIGQVDDFESKRCTMLKVKGDALLEAAVTKVEHAWGVDASRLFEAGLPIIRYLPGAPAVGKHGDEDRLGVVPNATLVVYLTEQSGGATAGRTVFPEAQIEVSPKAGSVLSFQNVDESGAPHPRAKHLVSPVPKEAVSDRLVLQIPIAIEGTDAKLRRYAYPEHVSGGKKPGQHESLHGSAEAKAACQAALAAGFGIAIAYMAAKAGGFDPGKIAEYEASAKDTGKFAEDDFKKPE